MGAANRVAGAVLIVIAAIVAAHTIAEPWYHLSTPEQPYSPLWTYIDPLSALAVALGLIFGFARKRAFDGELGAVPATWGRLASNTLFYGFVFVGIMFFTDWFSLLNANYTALNASAASILWTLVDALLPILAGALGAALLRGEHVDKQAYADGGGFSRGVAKASDGKEA